MRGRFHLPGVGLTPTRIILGHVPDLSGRVFPLGGTYDLRVARRLPERYNLAGNGVLAQV